MYFIRFQILQSDVDRYRGQPDDLVPFCALHISAAARVSVESKLKLKISLKGAKEPFNYFMLQCTCVPTMGMYVCACVLVCVCACVLACMCACMRACVCVYVCGGDKRRNTELRAEAGLERVEVILLRRRLKWLGQVAMIVSTRIPKCMLVCKPEGGKRLPGGQ